MEFDITTSLSYCFDLGYVTNTCLQWDFMQYQLCCNVLLLLLFLFLPGPSHSVQCWSILHGP